MFFSYVSFTANALCNVTYASPSLALESLSCENEGKGYVLGVIHRHIEYVNVKLLGMRDKTETHRNGIVRDILDEKLTMYSCRSFDSLALWFAMRMDLLRTVYRGRMCIRVNGIWGLFIEGSCVELHDDPQFPFLWVPLAKRQQTHHTHGKCATKNIHENHTLHICDSEERGMCLEFTSARMPMAH